MRDPLPVTNHSSRNTYRRGEGISVINPNRIDPAGAYYDPETGYGGQPRPPAKPLAEQRAEERLNGLRQKLAREHFDLAADPAIVQIIDRHASNRILSGMSLEDAYGDA